MSARDSGFELRFNGGDTLGDAVRASNAALSALELGPGDRDRLAVLIEELLANLIEHAHAPLIVLRGRREDGHVLLVVEDGGAAFDPRSADPGAPIPERGGGAGLALVRAWCERLDYLPGPPVNRFELRYTLSDGTGCD
jgi:serine/threonine-protein kinase RsbW